MRKKGSETSKKTPQNRTNGTSLKLLYLVLHKIII